MNWSRHAMLLLGAALTGFECWGVWEYMQFKNAPMYLACLGIALAISAPSLGLVRGPVQWLAIILAPIGIIAVLSTAMARMAAVEDVALQQHANAKRQGTLAEATVLDLVQTLDEARESVKKACKEAVTKKCTEAQAARNTAQSELKIARDAVTKVPIVAGDPAAQLVSDTLPGFISPERAAVIKGMSIPVVASVFAWAFFLAWRYWPVDQAAKEKPRQPAERPKLTVVPAPPPKKAYRVADALGSLRGAAGSRTELARVHQFYIEECKRRGHPPVSAHEFTDEVATWCKANRVDLQSIDGRVFIVGRKLVA